MFSDTQLSDTLLFPSLVILIKFLMISVPVVSEFLLEGVFGYTVGYTFGYTFGYISDVFGYTTFGYTFVPAVGNFDQISNDFRACFNRVSS